MSRQYTHVQGLLPSVIAMKEKGYTYRQIEIKSGWISKVVTTMKTC